MHFVLVAGALAVQAADLESTVRLNTLTVQPPSPPDWIVLRRDMDQVVFRRTDGSTSYVRLFELSDAASHGRKPFLDEARENVEEIARSLPDSRLIHVEHRPTNERPYVCSRSYLTTRTKTQLGPEGDIDTHFHILLCRSPAREGLGFVTAYSYHGSRSATNDQAAETFIRGVQVEPKSIK